MWEEAHYLLLDQKRIIFINTSNYRLKLELVSVVELYILHMTNIVSPISSYFDIIETVVNYVVVENIFTTLILNNYPKNKFP